MIFIHRAISEFLKNFDHILNEYNLQTFYPDVQMAKQHCHKLKSSGNRNAHSNNLLLSWNGVTRSNLAETSFFLIQLMVTDVFFLMTFSVLVSADKGNQETFSVLKSFVRKFHAKNCKQNVADVGILPTHHCTAWWTLRICDCFIEADL